jgi:2-C-methyl-D-erythritol 4-phosphate cytidylyltransferase
MVTSSAPGAAAVVVLAAGSGTRIGVEGNKVYLPLAARPLVVWPLRAFAAVAGVSRLLLVIRPDDRQLAEQVVDQVPATESTPVEIVDGGPTRHLSEQRALAHLGPAIDTGAIDVVAIHDGARPVVGSRLLAMLLDAARTHGAVIPGVPLADAAQVGADGEVGAVAVTGRLVTVQTPQVFLARPLWAAHQRAARDGFAGTDTAACVERYGGLRVHCVPGDPANIKVTYPADLVLAERLLARAH